MTVFAAVGYFQSLVPSAVVVLFGPYKSRWPLGAREVALFKWFERSEVALYGQISVLEYKLTRKHAGVPQRAALAGGWLFF